MKRSNFIFLLVICVSVSAFSQIHQQGTPVALNYQFDQPVHFVMPSPVTNNEYQADKEKPTALYAGYTVPFLREEQNRGIWDKTDNGLLTWRIGIYFQEAKALNIYFENLSLREGERLFIYSTDLSIVLGAFTSQNNGQFLATEFIHGNELIIEFSTTHNDFLIPFEINRFGVSVLDLDASSRDFGDAGFCEVLVSCPEGDSWQKENRGVARILVSEGSKLYWCSGSLMNNTNSDATPYMLTANHCGENSSLTDYANWVFYFLFESADCEMPSSEPNHKSLAGSQLIARSASSTNAGSDFKLLLLNDDVPDTYKLYFNGWDRTGEAAGSGVTIHHPEGDLKMVSTYDNPLVSTSYNNPIPNANGNYWKVNWVETVSGHGVTEGGSSGAPIFDPGGFVVGHLSGGRASCNFTDLPDYYGKFSYSWESNGSDSSRQLKPWLDPVNSGVETLRGSDFDTSGVIADFTASTTQVKVGESVKFDNGSVGNITQYEWRFQGGDPSTSEAENPPPIRYNNVGRFDVGLYVNSEDGKDSLVRKEYIHVLPILSPNPSRDNFNIIFGEKIPEDLDILVTDALGRKADFIVRQDGEMALTIDLRQNMAGLYLIKIKSSGNTQILKAVLYNE